MSSGIVKMLTIDQVEEALTAIENQLDNPGCDINKIKEEIREGHCYDGWTR